MPNCTLPRRQCASTRFALALALTTVFATAPSAWAKSSDPDPWIGMNRGIFAFNDALDRYTLEPVARGYHAVTPDIVEGWITNFLTNLWFPVVFSNCVLQGKPQEAAQSMARFLVNSTVGIAGFGDPATRLNVPAPNEDFGQTLGYWGVRPGPYVVLPLLGPSSIRDTAGRTVDSAARVWPWFVPWWASSGVGVVEVVSTRAKYLEEVSDLRESSLDFYVSVRNAYLQRREALVEDRVGATGSGDAGGSQDDLYYPSEEE